MVNAFQLPPITAEDKERLNPDSKEFTHLRIARFRLWTIFLSPNQYYPGRCYLWLNRHQDLQALSDLTEEEQYHLTFVVGKRLELALKELFVYDLMNYAWLGNEFGAHRGHGHMHFIPRYETPREFAGVNFVDEHWGKNYAPTPKWRPPESVFMKIRDELRSKLNSSLPT